MEDDGVIELPVTLVKEALDCLVPYLAKSKEDRTNSIETYDYSRSFVEAIVNEIQEGEPFCDHQVGICACGALAIIGELKLRLDGKKTCPDCHGEGYLYQATKVDDEFYTCPRCEGKGSVQVE